MKITGIICEYNPFHLGHRKQFERIRAQIGEETGIVCLMSGNYVQRGHPAIADKSLRARAAVQCGADLVLELPVTVSLSSAEGFAEGGVAILGHFCDYLSFGSESADAQGLMDTARALLSPEFPEKLRVYLDQGLSFPAARQAALGTDLLTKPNDILAAEYCKAILAQDSSMKPLVIPREGGYHDSAADPENPSATSLRTLMEAQEDWQQYMPQEAAACLEGAALHALAHGERAILARLRTMSDVDFEALPYGTEGLWRKFMHAARKYATVEEILTATKSKRYTRSRLDRMLMCAFLGITEEMRTAPVPYARVLALNDRGRQILNRARQTGCFPNTGESTAHPYELLEQRCEDLYGLFATVPEAPGTGKTRRVVYCR